MTIKDIQDRKAKAITLAREITENPDYTGEGDLEESYQRAVADARRFSQLEKDENERIVMEADLAESRSKLEAAIHVAESPSAPAVEDPFIKQVRNFCSVPTEETPVKRFLSIPVHKRANEEWFKDTGQTVKAGYTYTSKLMTDIIWHENAESGVLMAGPTFIDTADGNTLKWPMLATDASAAQTAERTAATLTEPVFSQPQLDSYRQDGYMILTYELIRDSMVNIMQAVGEVASRALATKIASSLATDDGSSKPDGLSHCAAAGVTAALSPTPKTVFVGDELIALYLSVLPGSRARGSWIAGSTALGLIFKMKDADGEYLLHDLASSPVARPGSVGTIMGKPLYEDAAYPACTTGLCPVTFGDVSAYRVRRVGDILIERDDSVYFTQFESVVRFAQFIDADLFDTATNKKITMG